MSADEPNEESLPGRSPALSRKYAKRGAFLKPRLKTDELYLEERQEWVRIREISLADFDEIERRLDEERKTPRINGQPPGFTFRAGIILAGCIDEHGKHLFTEDDLPAILTLPSRLANVLVEAITSLSVMTGEAIEEAEKNSAAGP